MAEFIIDLSGKKGLGDGFAGDIDMVTPRPELRMDDDTGFASGYFNPFLRDKYLAPTTTTQVSYSPDDTPASQFVAVEYDFTNDDTYWCDNVKRIWKGASLTATALTLIDTVDDAASLLRTYDALYDLQMYQINGNSRLFFVGKGIPFSPTPLIQIASQTTSDSFAASFVSVIPAATTQPTVENTYRYYDSGAAASATVSATVSAGSNKALVVIAFGIGDTPNTATFNGDSMTRLTVEGGSVSEPGVAVFVLPAPDVVTGNVVVNYSVSATHRLVYAIVTTNTEQTTVASAYTNVEHVTDSVGIIRSAAFPTSSSELSLVAAFSDQNFTIKSDFDVTTYLYDSLITYGRELLATVPVTMLGYGLQVGHTSVPATSLSSANSTFSSNINRPGAFIQKISGDYAFMRVADNGFAYVFSDNHVHKIDGNTTGGTTGTLTKDVLLFPGTFRITDAVDYRSNLYLGVHQYSVTTATTSLSNYTGKCGIYVWNRISTQLSSADYIELPGAREIKKIYASPDGVLKLITISDNGTTELREFGYNDSGGVVFPVKKRLGIGAFPQLPDGLSTAGDKVTWLANDGNIYVEKGNAVTKLHQVKAPGTGTAGLAQNITSGALLYGSATETAGDTFRTNKQGISFSYKDGSSYYTKKIYPFDLTTGANAAQTPLQGDVYTQVKLVPIGSAVRNIRIYNAPTTTSDTTVIATVKIYFNQSATASMPSGMTKSITKAEAKRGYVDFHINKSNIHAVQIEVEWATGVSIGDDMYMPSVAVVTYDELKTQSPDNG